MFTLNILNAIGGCNKKQTEKVKCLPVAKVNHVLYKIRATKYHSNIISYKLGNVVILTCKLCSIPLKFKLCILLKRAWGIIHFYNLS